MSRKPKEVDEIADTVLQFPENGGDSMKAKEIVDDFLRIRGWKQRELADKLGVSPQNFSKKLVNDTISAKEFFEVMEALDVGVTYTDKSTGEVRAERKPGVIPRVSMVVDKIRYDTHKSDALCHTEEQDGWLMELYRDDAGRYYIVHYTVWDGVKPSISPCSEKQAIQFYKTYGDVDGEIFQIKAAG